MANELRSGAPTATVPPPPGLTPPPTLALVRDLGSGALDEAALRSIYGAAGEPAQRWEVVPGVQTLPFRTPTLPPATHTNTYLVGTGEAPQLVGNVFVDPTRLKLPATTLRTTSGTVNFDPANPYVPRLDLRAETRMRGYDLSVAVTGPYDAPEIVVNTVPPMSSRDSLLLLATGHPPGNGPILAQSADLGLDIEVTGPSSSLTAVMEGSADAAVGGEQVRRRHGGQGEANGDGVGAPQGRRDGLSVEEPQGGRMAEKGNDPPQHGYLRISLSMASTFFLASPNSISVLSLKNSGFCTPA